MNVTIQVDEARFNDIIQKELAALSHDELRSIVIEGITTYMKESGVIRELFVSSNFYGRNEPTYLLKQLVEKIDINKECEELAGAVKDAIVNDIDGVVTRLISGMFANALFDKFKTTGLLQDAVMEALRVERSMNDN